MMGGVTVVVWVIVNISEVFVVGVTLGQLSGLHLQLHPVRSCTNMDSGLFFKACTEEWVETL